MSNNCSEIILSYNAKAGMLHIDIVPGDCVVFLTGNHTYDDAFADARLYDFEDEGKWYEFYDLSDGARYYAAFKGLEELSLTNEERYEVLYLTAMHDMTHEDAVAFIKEIVWDELLQQYCGCYEDAVGNRPCDNGAMCDKCRNDNNLLAIYNGIMQALGITK